MTKAEKTRIISKAAHSIWNDFVWLWNNTKTPFASGEYKINAKFTVFAFEESDSENSDDHWITITIERYNSKGRCVDDFVVTAITSTLSERALTSGVSHLLKMFENKFGSLELLSGGEKNEDQNH